ncbi:hypothetical protein M2281_005499 [Mesorhizobium soli]|nr:hypothetical protein [Mesorhizobium soli]
MTTITDPEAPPAGTVDSLFDRKISTGRLVACVCAAAAVMTGINLAAAVYFFRGIGELRAAEQRLQGLSDFEARIIAKMDKVNIGMQTRLEELDRGLQGRFSEINDHFDKIERSSPPSKMETSLPPVADAASDDTVPLEKAAPEFQVAVEPAVAPSSQGQQSLPAPSSAYQRIETADGKVYYRKVK